MNIIWSYISQRLLLYSKPNMKSVVFFFPWYLVSNSYCRACFLIKWVVHSFQAFFGRTKAAMVRKLTCTALKCKVNKHILIASGDHLKLSIITVYQEHFSTHKTADSVPQVYRNYTNIVIPQTPTLQSNTFWSFTGHFRNPLHQLQWKFRAIKGKEVLKDTAMLRGLPTA